MASGRAEGKCELPPVPTAPRPPNARGPSIPVPIAWASALARERISGIDAAIGKGTTRGGHALGVAGELAIAGVAPLAPLQAVAILYGLSSSSRYWSDCGQGGNSCQNGEGNMATHGRDSFDLSESKRLTCVGVPDADGLNPARPRPNAMRWTDWSTWRQLHWPACSPAVFLFLN
jgi:hypothetical protein